MDKQNKGEKFLDQDFFPELIEFYTDGIPQYVQELSLEIAFNAENNRNTIDEEVVRNSINEWILESVISEYSRVIKSTNAPGTKHGRRNQCIYAMSRIYSLEFSKKEIETKLKSLFPSSTRDISIKVSSTLSELVKKPSPIIKMVPNSKMYRFITPKAKIITRWMFTKLLDEELVITKISEAT